MTKVYTANILLVMLLILSGAILEKNFQLESHLYELSSQVQSLEVQLAMLEIEVTD